MTSRIAMPLTVCALLALTSCGSSSDNAPQASNTGQSSSTSATSAPATSGLSVTDAWVKALPDLGEKAMTGAFGKIKNTTDHDITIVSATQNVSDTTELHEMVTKDGKQVMKPVEGGFTVKAGATLELKPYHDHIMIMKMTKSLPIGEKVTFTLVTKDGAKVEFTAPAKQFTAPQENYSPGTGTSSHAMSHSSSSTK
ncbi:copper chaperone PCu(A)C [Austwickia sp. TVS 96-490-7B]|uniref:copper chaperone PCu(A)C n=1 Tax=Austwickia sp. TVS 96-490-7B TaxID=2830843 RepID=UPI001C566530|nr:copper chaperone PCu(A)C [Austwickia sp. TVS 96-490-7B]